MLFFVMAVLAAMPVFYALQDRSRMALFVSGSYVGLIMVIFAYVLIWTKNGGIQSTAQFALFLLPALGRWLLYLPVSASGLSCLLLSGKSLFLCSSMLMAVYISQPLRRRLNLLLYGLSVCLPALNFILLSPKVYERYCQMDFFRYNQIAIFNVLRALYVLCVALCFFLTVRRYALIRITWIKRRFYHIILLNGYLFLLFILFGVLGPIQVSNFTGIYYITANFLYMSSRLPWLIITLSSLFFTVLGSRALWSYSRISQQIGRPDISIGKKLKDSNASVRMFTHGMKNQLLVLRAMLRDLQEEVQLSEEAACRIAEISDVSRSMLDRMDELYNVFKNDAMTMTEVREPFEIVEKALEKLGTCPVPVRTECIQQRPILADAHHLSEALYNILKNAEDAVLCKPSCGQEAITVRLYLDRKDMVFEVRDTGEGIDPKNVRRIFDPFYTSKNSKSNWGIGLSYVQQVVKGHDGQLSIDSSLGQGTTIYLSIPTYGKA